MYPNTNPASPNNGLKITFLGGLLGVGEKNMTIIEYQGSALVLDCGMNLGIDIPGINYEICDFSYLESIRHKLEGYVITHGHLDHIGGLKHTVPRVPAPIFASRYTNGFLEKLFEDARAETGVNFTPKLVTMNLDNHEQVKLGLFTVEFIRVTHSIPDAAAISIDTPLGRIIATGDFRLDPEPLDHLPSDTTRLRELGDKGVLLLLSESSYAEEEGRTPTEQTLEKSFHDVITDAQNRVLVAVFSSNINRIQMIINAAVQSGRKVAFDGRSMLSYAEIAVKHGLLKVPKGTIISLQSAAKVTDGQVLIICTGGQGEPNAALQRMSEGTHKYLTLSAKDTILISSSPIPGNELSYQQISDRLTLTGAKLYRHPTHQIDGCGPLHVSGHARRDELREMIALTRPKYFIPNHGGSLRRRYHAKLGIEMGVPTERVLLPNNGDSLVFGGAKVHKNVVKHGSLYVNEDDKIIRNLQSDQDRFNDLRHKLTRRHPAKANKR